MVDVLDGTEIVQIPHRGPQGHTTTQAIANIAPHVAGATDANLFVVDTASDQVSVGSAAVNPYRKFYVNLTTADMTVDGETTGHAAIESRADITGQGTAAINPGGGYSTLWYRPLTGIGNYTGSGAAVVANAYTIDTAYAANVTNLIGVKARARHENTHGTVTNAIGLFADGAQKGPGAGTITNAYGVYVNTQVSATFNVGVLISGTPNSGSIASDTDITLVSNGVIAVQATGTIAANQTGLLITVNNGAAVLKTVQIGAADSGGTGFRMLRVTN